MNRQPNLSGSSWQDEAWRHYAEVKAKFVADFVQTLIDVVSNNIKVPGSASAVVPMLVQEAEPHYDERGNEC